MIGSRPTPVIRAIPNTYPSTTHFRRPLKRQLVNDVEEAPGNIQSKRPSVAKKCR